VPTFQNRENVAQRRTLRRRHDADFAGKGGNRPVAFGLEQDFPLELLFELFENELPRAKPGGLGPLRTHLILPARLLRDYRAPRALRTCLPCRARENVFRFPGEIEATGQHCESIRPAVALVRL